FLPFIAARAAAIDAQLAIHRIVLAVTLDGNDVDGIGLVRVYVDDEAEVGRKIAADFLPVVAGVVAAHNVPVLLHEERVGTRVVHGDVVDAVSDLGVGIGDVLRAEAAIDGLPADTAVVGAESARSGDGDVHTLVVGGIEDDGVKAHAAGTGLPARTGAVLAEAGEFFPVLATVGGLEQ